MRGSNQIESDLLDYGLLVHEDTTLHRCYFEEMTKLIGIQAVYYAPKRDKHYSQYTEIKGQYYEPIATGCIFEEHPQQRTLRTLNWVSELQESESIIHVKYDLPGLQAGSLFAIPSGLDKNVGRLFRVVRISNIMIFPASITCSIVPEWANTFDESQLFVSNTDFNLLVEEDS